MKYLSLGLAIVLLQACSSTSDTTQTTTQQTNTQQSALTAIDQTTENGQVRLIVKTMPLDARVRIMNIKPKYKDGIALDKGRYDIEVSKPGFATKRQWIDLKESKIIEFSLSEQTQS